jgi:uncharacterized OB-fold protein
MEYKLTAKMFSDALREGRLLGLKCGDCGAHTVPPKKVCMECGSENMETSELMGTGAIQTFTVVRTPPEGFEAPYIVAMAALDEGPWVMGNVVNVDPDEASMDLIGKRVTVGHKVHPGDQFSAGEMVAMTFSIQP